MIPLTMLSFKKVRINPDLSYLAALSAILGFVTNRLNVAMTSMETWAGHHYIPKWTEVSITADDLRNGLLRLRDVREVSADL